MCYYKDFMNKRILLLSIYITIISLLNNDVAYAEGPKNYLKGKFYSSVKDHFLIATEKMRDDRFVETVIVLAIPVDSPNNNIRKKITINIC